MRPASLSAARSSRALSLLATPGVTPAAPSEDDRDTSAPCAGQTPETVHVSDGAIRVESGNGPGGRRTACQTSGVRPRAAHPSWREVRTSEIDHKALDRPGPQRLKTTPSRVSRSTSSAVGNPPRAPRPRQLSAAAAFAYSRTSSSAFRGFPQASPQPARRGRRRRPRLCRRMGHEKRQSGSPDLPRGPGSRVPRG